jgi:hypothetical protein
MNIKLPTLPARPGRTYPDPETRLGAAWSESYERIRGAAEPVDGRVLADEIAPKHGLFPSTLVALYTRMASAGHLKRDHTFVETGRGPRKRTHYSV